ncbi:ABC transporter ATP-binding protein [Micromonospora craniellae]|uniref:ABC transporter ATP-binding protein n=1 Tax=Micromonospora craniellae TaxID=2294034 RepID=A0A372FYP0_9ACTN|nr:ABC transporter ATP-binding protein [Micromonospora craniellae]QOC93398.1 ABC transporter ATP-binding protein [Micromonospora craniellae]RFS45843.1 ABC transporter ATP-binding protein [Micromonospora craniellae]
MPTTSDSDLPADLALDVRDATKTFQQPGGQPVHALQDVSLAVRPGDFVTLLGPSGCGKSTLLNAIAGLTSLTSGKIVVAGQPVRGPGLDRSVVFQQASLLPWRTVRGNIAYGMELQRAVKKSEQTERTAWAMDLVGLTEFADRFPSQLSGGMQQRVNLARALATRPKVLLMDEPFGALDAMTKARLQIEVSTISRDTGATVLFVTHDIDEALLLADRVVVMSRRPGRISRVFEVPEKRPRNEEFLETKAFVTLRRELRLSIEDSLVEQDREPSTPSVRS